MALQITGIGLALYLARMGIQLRNRFKLFLSIKTVQLLVVGLPFFAHLGGGTLNQPLIVVSLAQGSNVASAQTKPDTSSIPDGWESYLGRPDILSVDAKDHQFNQQWQALKAAHFSMVAELLALYPQDTHLYFLARDSEYLYDVARLVTVGTNDQQRLHLLNISRANMRDSLVYNYLAENGLSKESLSAGKKVVFIDTGFSGTIPRVIQGLYPSELGSQLKTHLIVSSNSEHPSSRVFLNHLNSTVNSMSPSHMHGTVVQYEHMLRYTDRSSKFILVDGKYHPISQTKTQTDGSVSKVKSLERMQDLKFEWHKPTIIQSFQQELGFYKKLRNIISSEPESAIAQLKPLLEKKENHLSDKLLEAFIRDALESKKQAAIETQLTVGDLGLKVVNPSKAGISKKNDLIKSHPEWASVLENPDTEIPPLFKNENWQLIGNLIDADVDKEINQLIIKQLYDGPATGIKKKFQVLVIEKGDTFTLQYLAQSIFSQPQTKDMTDLIELLIEKGDSSTLPYLARFTFTRPHTKDMTDLIKLLIEKNDPATLQYLAQFTFFRPHIQDMRDLIKLLIEKNDPATLQNLARFTFSEPHTKDMTDLIKLLIEKGDSSTLQFLAQFTFSQSHTKDMTDLIKFLIRKGNDHTLQKLAYFTFSRPHTKDMIDLVKLLIEKGDPITLQYLATYTFSQSHTHTSKHNILRKALEISDPKIRKIWLDENFSKLTSSVQTQSSTDNATPAVQAGNACAQSLVSPQ